jgi:transcriptional regulator with XRE-family HTH domain
MARPRQRTEGGEALRAWLLREQRSQESLARELDVSFVSVNRWINGAGRPRGGGVLRALRKLTGIDPAAWKRPAPAGAAEGAPL